MTGGQEADFPFWLLGMGGRNQLYALPFTEKVPKGIVVFHEGFLANG